MFGGHDRRIKNIGGRDQVNNSIDVWLRSENVHVSSVSTVYVYPICSTYGIFTYISVIFRANVGKYSIHGAYGNVYIYMLI